jgi:bifunctional oligoribonuclease and PAP phosphatase NrnA
MFSEILKSIEAFDRIIIHRHSRPDGDAIGSQIGWKEAIKTTFPEKTVYAVGDRSEKFSFLGEMDEVVPWDYDEALVFVLDSAEAFLVSGDDFRLGKKVIKIDHHISRENFGDANFVDTSFESCAGYVAWICFSLNMQLSDLGAKALFTGMVTDSGRFRYDSTNARTFMLAARLSEYGFDLSEVYNQLYIDELHMVRLRAQFALNFKVTGDQIAYIKNTKEDIARYETDFFTISRGMVNTMAGIRGIDIWVNFTEDEVNNTVVAEIRSGKYNINQVAVKYGGGGHKLASGATLSGFDEADRMLEDLSKLQRGEFEWE